MSCQYCIFFVDSDTVEAAFCELLACPFTVKDCLLDLPKNSKLHCKNQSKIAPNRIPGSVPDVLLQNIAATFQSFILHTNHI